MGGGQLLELCSNCVTATGDYSDAANSIITVNKALSVAAGDQLLVGGYVHADTKTAVATATAAGGTHSTGASGTITMSGGSNNGILCANTDRGTCDSATGVCKCFKGYSNDNCDNQNMLAM